MKFRHRIWRLGNPNEIRGSKLDPDLDSTTRDFADTRSCIPAVDGKTYRMCYVPTFRPTGTRIVSKFGGVGRGCVISGRVGRVGLLLPFRRGQTKKLEVDVTCCV